MMTRAVYREQGTGNSRGRGSGARCRCCTLCTVPYLLLLVVGATPSLADGVDVTVRPSAEVREAQVLLPAIASITGSDQALTEKIEVVAICPAPLPGKTQTLTRDQIIVALRRGGVSDGSVDLLCPESVTITRTGSIVTGRAIFEAVEQRILASEWNGKVTVEPVRLPSDLTTPVGEVEIRLKSEKFRRGSNTVGVDILVDGKVFRTTHVSLVIRVLGPMLVARQSIAKASEITGENTIIETRDLTNLPNEAVTEAPEPGVIAAVPIAEGAVIRQNWVTNPPVIRRGDVVAVVVKGEFVTISDKGTAASDGKLGDRIKIRMKGEVREVRGTVTGPGLVEVHLRRS